MEARHCQGTKTAAKDDVNTELTTAGTTNLAARAQITRAMLAGHYATGAGRAVRDACGFEYRGAAALLSLPRGGVFAPPAPVAAMVEALAAMPKMEVMEVTPGARTSRSGTAS